MKRHRGREGGFILIVAAIGAFLAAGFCVTIANLSRAADRRAEVRKYQTQAIARAEGAVERAKKRIQESIANWSAIPPSGTVTIDGIPVNYTIVPTGFSTVQTDVVGTQSLLDGYEIEATANVQGYTIFRRRIVNSEAIPLFQYAVFYMDDLEIEPGPDMTLTGRIRTNGDLYFTAGASLWIDTNHLRASGRLYRHRKDNPSSSGGNVQLRKWVENPFDVSEPKTFATLYGEDNYPIPTGAVQPAGISTKDWMRNLWAADVPNLYGPPSGYSKGTGQTVMTGDHGIVDEVLPVIGSTSMFEPSPSGTFVWDSLLGKYVPAGTGGGTHEKGYYHGKAGLSVITFADGTWAAKDGSGNDVTASLSGVVTTTTMYDSRQANGTGTKVKITQIDLDALKATGKFPGNGLLYASHYGMGTGTAASGIRLVNGADLAGPLTVVSEGPVYVKGDFNTVAKKPASVICDAINLLSNAWNDSKGAGTLPIALPTTFNLAFITGNQETNVGAYNGGLENLPRFHENWTGITCTIKGSFVCAWKSRYATSTWKGTGGDLYRPPVRVWGFDSDLNDVTKLPPHTPLAVGIQDVVSW